MPEKSNYSGLVDRFMRELENYITLPEGAFIERVVLEYSTLRDRLVPYKAEATIQRLPNRDRTPYYVFDWGETPENALEKLKKRLAEKWPKNYPTLEETIRETSRLKTAGGSWINIPEISIMPQTNGRFRCRFEIIGASPVFGSGDTIEEAAWGARFALGNRYDIVPLYEPRVISRQNLDYTVIYWLHRSNPDGKYFWHRSKDDAYEFPEDEYNYWIDNPKELLDLLPMSGFSPKPEGYVEWIKKSCDCRVCIGGI